MAFNIMADKRHICAGRSMVRGSSAYLRSGLTLQRFLDRSFQVLKVSRKRLRSLRVVLDFKVPLAPIESALGLHVIYALGKDPSALAPLCVGSFDPDGDDVVLARVLLEKLQICDSAGVGDDEHWLRRPVDDHASEEPWIPVPPLLTPHDHVLAKALLVRSVRQQALVVQVVFGRVRLLQRGGQPPYLRRVAELLQQLRGNVVLP
mmetsp:Transcript_11327/g.21812  ORF Transcript_11327/g.21812 Transcript_11327/m.21812 type:complete len:205 (+) Transcript_11327:34-648(+)